MCVCGGGGGGVFWCLLSVKKHFISVGEIFIQRFWKFFFMFVGKYWVAGDKLQYEGSWKDGKYDGNGNVAVSFFTAIILSATN